ARANVKTAVSAESDDFARTSHRAPGIEGRAGRAHGERWRRRAPSSGNPSRRQQTFTLTSYFHESKCDLQWACKLTTWVGPIPATPLFGRRRGVLCK